eukprot:jgi/Hompol1/2502/HPOL_006024-RA
MPLDAFIFKPSSQLQLCPQHQKAFFTRDLDYFKIFVGPAAGPRAFVSAGFEKRLKNLILQNKLTGVKWLVGGSTGALRFMAFVNSLVSNRNLTWELKEHYCGMYYKKGDTPAVLKPMMDRAYEICAPRESIRAALNHPTFKLAIIVCNVLPIFHSLPNIALQAVLAGFYLGNMVSSEILQGFCTRLCFYTGDEPPVFLNNGLGGEKGIEYHKLTEENVYQVLHATTCVPFVLERCEYIPGVGSGLFVDGAVTDYYLNNHFTDPDAPALLLADSVKCRIYRTAFEAYLPWHRPTPEHLFDHCSAIYPADSYIEALPERRLPNMGDWFDKEYIEAPHRRHHNWRTVFKLSEDLWHYALQRASEHLSNEKHTAISSN